MVQETSPTGLARFGIVEEEIKEEHDIKEVLMMKPNRHARQSCLVQTRSPVPAQQINITG